MSRILEVELYKIDEHPDKEKCFDWIRENWHDLNQHSADELVDSINALNKAIGGTFDYSISCVPAQGEFIAFSDYDEEALKSLVADDYPLTGVFWDEDVIKGLKKKDFSDVLEILHNETEARYSDECLRELCEAHDYEFYESGEVF